MRKSFFNKFPNRSTECFIAEQNMVGVATGFGARGKVPFASTFACFFTRAFDQIRVAGISQANLNSSFARRCEASARTARRRWRWKTSP